MHHKIEKICKEVSEELDIPLELTREIVKNQFNWLRRNLISMEYPSILLNKLGTFNVLERRAGEHKDKVQEYKKGFKKPKDGKTGSDVKEP